MQFTETAKKSEREMDALMSEMLDGNFLPGEGGEGGARVAREEAGPEWDKMTLLTGGFVPVGSIFWARPPKLFSQQKIMLAIDAADKAGQGEDTIQGLVKQSDILCKLASELLFVQEGTQFRPATEEEIGGDEVGLDAEEIKNAFFRLMGIDTSAEADTEGNA